jgi:1,4-dihydroxy-6-naphthoate synthase
MGDNYGPMVVAREPLSTADLAGKRIAIPGRMTTAFLTLQLLTGKDAFDAGRRHVRRDSRPRGPR